MINNQNSEVLSEFYIIIILNKLKIVENTKRKYGKLKIKGLWLRLWGPSDS